MAGADDPVPDPVPAAADLAAARDHLHQAARRLHLLADRLTGESRQRTLAVAVAAEGCLHLLLGGGRPGGWPPSRN